MSEQLPQNKNEQNDNSAFDSDLYQDFDAEAGLQADLAAFNSRLDAIKTEHDNRHDDAFNPAASAARKLHYIPEADIRSKEELLAMPRAKDKFGITAQGSSEGPQPEPAKPVSRAEARKNLKDAQRSQREAERQNPVGNTDIFADRTVVHTDDETAPTAPVQKKGLRARFSRDEEARTRDENTRDAQRRHKNGEDRTEAEKTQKPLIETIKARPLGGAISQPVAKAEKPEITAENYATNPEDQAGNARVETRSRRAKAEQANAAGPKHAAPKGKAAKAATRAAAPAAVSANTAASSASEATLPPRISREVTARTGRTSLDAIVGEPVFAPEEDGDNITDPNFFSTPMFDSPVQIPDVNRPESPAEADDKLMKDFEGVTSTQSFDTHVNGINGLVRAGVNLPPEAAPVANPDPTNFDPNQDPSFSNPQPFPHSNVPRLHSTQEVKLYLDDNPIQMGQPVVRPGASEGGSANTSTGSDNESGSLEGDDYDFDAFGNNAAAPVTDPGNDDPFAHLFRPVPEAPATTPLDVVAAPGETASGRALVTDALNRLGKNFRTGYAYDNRAYFVEDSKTGESMTIFINDLDNPDYLQEKLDAIKTMHEAGMTRREKAASVIGGIASRVVGGGNRMQRIQNRWDARRAGIEAGENGVVDMTPEAEAFNGDPTRRDARNAETAARRAERAEARRERRENEGSFVRRHRRGLGLSLAGLALADAALVGVAINNSANDDNHNTSPGVSASPTPGATSETPSPSASSSASPSASARESASPSASVSGTPSAEAPSATPSNPTVVNPDRPNAPEPGQGGNGSTGNNTGSTGPRTEAHDGEVLTFSADGKTVSAKLRPGGSILGAAQDAKIDATAAANAVVQAGITDQQARSLQPGQIVNFTQTGTNSYKVDLG